MRATLRRLPREPALHFALAGALLFAVYAHVGPRPREGATNEIVVTRQDVARLREEHRRLMGRPPNDDEEKALVAKWVDDEMRYREAIALGLERDDPIVHARLAYKMQFLMEDTAPPHEPTDAELTAFMATVDEFHQPERVSFDQVFVSSDHHGQAMDADARALLQKLRAGADPAMLGDPFVSGRSFAGRSATEVTSSLGAPFARAVFDAPVGVWQGPIASSYGLHLVRVTAHIEARLLPLDEARGRAHELFVDAERVAASEAAASAMRAKYKVSIEPAPAGSVVGRAP